MSFVKQPRTLSKSRFVMGLKCPQKLVYASDCDTYRNLNDDNSFLKSLAEGGFQVGELAKAHFPGGHDVTTLNQADALAETAALLESGDVVIFEAAIQFENCFIRVDVLEKIGDRFRLHEVKAKSFDSTKERPFLKQDGMPNSHWEPYCYDVAFQKWVVKRAFPKYNVTANLMLVDKHAVCPIDGLNQCFRIVRDEKRTTAQQVKPIPQSVLDAGLLKSIPVDDICDVIYSAESHGKRYRGRFVDLVTELSAVCAGRSEPAITMLGDCKDCEFKRLNAEDTLVSGFDTCLSHAFSTVKAQTGETVFDLWDYKKKDKLLSQGVISLVQLSEDDIGTEAHEASLAGQGVTRQQRQWMQVEKAKSQDNAVWLDKTAWRAEIDSWTYPLHFIDFETTRVALPFFRGQKPYQSIAFQFSHHEVDEQGHIRHADQFLCADASQNPNIAFVRALKQALGADVGTIFMYSPHENTTLRDILFEVWDAVEPDIEELKAFLMSLVRPSKDSARQWSPSRPMVDQLQLVKRFLYLPHTHGSNSLKYVLPAILNASDYLKSRYSQPIYGKGQTIPSLNLDERVWIKREHDGSVQNPYLALPNLVADLPADEQTALEGMEIIKEGGAALTAYSRLMYEDLMETQRGAIEKGLLEYCELDTLAMVFLHQGVLDLLGDHEALLSSEDVMVALNPNSSSSR